MLSCYAILYAIRLVERKSVVVDWPQVRDTRKCRVRGDGAGSGTYIPGQTRPRAAAPGGTCQVERLPEEHHTYLVRGG